MNKILNYTLIMGAMLMSAACAPTKALLSDTEVSTWQLKTMPGMETPVFDIPDSYTVRFSPKDSLVSGAASCNRFFGRYEAKDNGGIRINIGGSTMMACPGMENEHSYILMLNEANKYKIEDGQLYFIQTTSRQACL